MFHEGIEEYAMSNTSLVSPDIQTIATDTGAQELFSPCMVGTLESQFLKLQVQVSGAKKVLDVGTFTGMSALAMAEGLPNDGKVVTIECSDDCADVAEACFKKAKHGQKVTLLRGNAVTIMKEMLKSKFELSTLIESNEIHVSSHFGNFVFGNEVTKILRNSLFTFFTEQGKTGQMEFKVKKITQPK